MATTKIKSDIERSGFTDTAGAGTAGQVRTLNSSDEEVWATIPTTPQANTGSDTIIKLGRRTSTGTEEITLGRRT